MIRAISLLAAAGSDTGLVRKNNEDAAYSGRWLYAVADGMGGHAAGEVASAAVIESLRRHDTGVDPDATLTAMLWSDSRFALANIGDSRAFSLREGRFRQITEDHVLGKLVSNAGRLAPVLSRYLDDRPDRSPDLSLHEARPGDRYMICSDGLSPVVGTEAIRRVLSSVADPDEAVRQLADLTIEAGGPDNLTVIVIDVRKAIGNAAAVRPVVLGSAATKAVAS